MGPLSCLDEDIMNDGSEQAIPAFGSDFQALLHFLLEDGTSTTFSPGRFGLLLGTDPSALTSACLEQNGVSPTVESKYLQAHLREAVRVIQLATDLVGSVDKSLAWFKDSPLQVFGCKTPHMLVSEGRTDDLVRYLSSLEDGFAG